MRSRHTECQAECWTRAKSTVDTGLRKTVLSFYGFALNWQVHAFRLVFILKCRITKLCDRVMFQRC